MKLLQAKYWNFSDWSPENMLKNTTGGLTTQDGKGSKQGIDFEFILLFAYKVSSTPAYFFILYKQSTVPVYSMNEWNCFL
jgi:hypothetical protein